jgi:MFS family permease
LVVRDDRLVGLFSIRVIVRLAIRTIGPILPLFVQSLMPTATRIASITGLITGAQAATSAIGAVTLGRASDRLGYKRVLLVCTAGAAILYVPQFLVTSAWQLLILQAAVGFVMSGVLASISALLANLAPEGRQGAVYGVDASMISIANGIGPMLGATMAATLGLRSPFLLSGLALGLASLLAWRLVPSSVNNESPGTEGPGDSD